MLSSLPLPLINTLIVAAILPLLMLSACGRAQQPETTEYLNAATTLVDNEIVQVDVVAQGGDLIKALPVYADCVAAQYTLIRGLAYLRRVSGSQRGGLQTRTETTIYKLSDIKPQGARVIDAQETLATCQSLDIPTF